MSLPEMHHQLAILADWTLASPFEQIMEIEGLENFLSGLQATHPQWGEVVGSAASQKSFPSQRAFFELVERISILESMSQDIFKLRDMQTTKITRLAPINSLYPYLANQDGSEKLSFQYAKSNGVALHNSWTEACQSACFELVERHLVLSSWVGLTQPILVRNDSIVKELQQLCQAYEVLSISFGQQNVSCISSPIYVGGLVLLSKKWDAPLVVGFGAGLSLQEALLKASNEGLQRLGFLWGEEIPLCEPEFQPSPLYHQEYFLVPKSRSKLESWLEGKFLVPADDASQEISTLQIQFADLSSFKRPEFRVAKALCPQAMPLVFGRWREREFSGLPEERLIHPIA